MTASLLHVYKNFQGGKDAIMTDMKDSQSSFEFFLCPENKEQQVRVSDKYE
jgi:hypothetical protein